MITCVKLSQCSVLHFWAGCLDATDESTRLSSDLAERANVECKKFVLEKAAEKYRDETHVFDTYLKEGKVVVEVGYRDKDFYRRRGDDSYSARICVYDESEGTVMLPSALDMSEWRK
jgi:hypothetical protein